MCAGACLTSVPLHNVVALLWIWRKQNDIGNLESLDHQVGRSARRQHYPTANGCWVNDVKCPPCRGEFETGKLPLDDDGLLNLKAVLRTEHAVHELWAELVKAVAAQVVGRRGDEDPAANFDHLHQIGERRWYIEHVFQSTTVNHGIEAAV